MTLIVRHLLPDGKKQSEFHRFAGKVIEIDQSGGLHLVVQGVEGENGARAEIEIDLSDGDAAHVVDATGATVTTFRRRSTFGADKRKAS